MCDRGKQTAFTLIEVLVVVAIIALLIAILLPSLTRARAMARSSVCANTLREHANGMATFAAEHKDLVPRGASPRTRFTWIQLMTRMYGDKAKYGRNYNLVPVEKQGVFQCPERENNYPGPFLDYVINALDHRGPLDAAGRPSRTGAWVAVEGVAKRSLWKRPAEVIYTMDAANESTENTCGELAEVRLRIWELRNPKIDIPAGILPESPWGWGRYDIYTGPTVPAYPEDASVDGPYRGRSRGALKMHYRGSNASFADGHAETVVPPRRDTPTAVAQFYMYKLGVLNAFRDNLPILGGSGGGEQYSLGDEDFQPY
jgi:prepilin-type N-terminal cleavage/methylation domain-containing protein/prepilin-type processing-associated H-X9-DG protein